MWIVSNSKIADKIALQHSITKELCLFGKFGEIWPNGDSYKALVKGNLKSKISRFLELTAEVGTYECELLVNFTNKQLPFIVSMLKVPRSANAQLEIANEKTS